MKPSGNQGAESLDGLLDRVAAAGPVRELLDRVRGMAGETDRGRVDFEHVCPAATAFVCALVARAAGGRAWLLCPDVRSQEAIQSELLNWIPEVVRLPESESARVEGALPDPELEAERLGVLERLADPGWAGAVAVTAAALEELAPAPERFGASVFPVETGAALALESLAARLEVAGYERASQVSLRGQFAVRGGIVDFFSWQDALPVRVEFFGDSVESIRRFDPDAQVSVEKIASCRVLVSPEERGGGARVRDWIGPGDLVVEIGGDGEDRADVRVLEGTASAEGIERFDAAFPDHGLGEFEAGDLVVQEAKRERLFSQLREWLDGGWAVRVLCNNEGEMERLADLFPADLQGPGGPAGLVGALAGGFVVPCAKLAVLSDAELFGRYRHTVAQRAALRRAHRQAVRAPLDFGELAEGDLVVHLDHGIGRYLGLREMDVGRGTEEVLALEFAGDARLYVPVEQAHLVARYVGVGKRSPALSSLGDGKWARARRSAEKAAFDYASGLLRIQAERETSRGHAFEPDNKWQDEFERSFLYTETPDQVRAIAEAKGDMESERPMDRLVCGDVGFGKTEVAIRAAFKAVMGGKQVAVLVPTTVLAQQHYRTFRERMSDYPVNVEMLSRFRTAREQASVVKGLADGSVDIVVGTHRLISPDLRFKDLGLVVVDEEQRFGVMQKERFKERFQLVDVLTLSATPIPRTLYLSLMGARDMSLIETPPPNRIPVETVVCGYDERVMRDAIVRELARGGQVFLLHNRIGTIGRMAARVNDLCPGARVAVGHGQMEEGELEGIMKCFVDGGIDVLVSTTIIESGIDIPNANTIIIDRADRFGLADLYQLRGRVGRSGHKAYAYLFLPRESLTTGNARKRVNAIRQYSSLGAGFKIAMRDLEIRGAGNVLGTAQSGHIVAVGFDLYCQLLRRAVAQLKGGERPRVEVAVDFDFLMTKEAAYRALPPGDQEAAAAAFLPARFLPETKERIKGYRDLANAAGRDALDRLRRDWRDRFGPLPVPVENLFRVAGIKVVAASQNVTKVAVADRKLMLTRRGDYLLVDGKFPRLRESATGDERLEEVLDLLRRL